jgi:hypothetical protein
LRREFDQAGVPSGRTREIAIFAADPSAGNPRHGRCTKGLTPQPRAGFASELRPGKIPPEQVVFSKGLTLLPQPIFAVGICHRDVPREGHVVDRDNHGSEDSLAPSRVVRSRIGTTSMERTC